jgi:hypothetical protein
MLTKKNNIYICGDSFVDWDLPEIHWTDYLSNHYNIIKLGKFGSDNNSILYQTGNIPNYVKGDRLVIVFTAPGRFPRRYFGERDINHNLKYLNWEWYSDKSFAKKLLELRVKETESWYNGDRDAEIFFIKKLKYFYKKYEPIFVTWNDDFYEKTKEFVELIKVTSIADEGGDPIDWHPGSKGCYDFYLKLHQFLNIDESVIEFENKKNKLI